MACPLRVPWAECFAKGSGALADVQNQAPSEQRADVSVNAGPVITGVHTALVHVPLGQRTITDS